MFGGAVILNLNLHSFAFKKFEMEILSEDYNKISTFCLNEFTDDTEYIAIVHFSVILMLK